MPSLSIKKKNIPTEGFYVIVKCLLYWNQMEISINAATSHVLIKTECVHTHGHFLKFDIFFFNSVPSLRFIHS